MLFHLDNAPVHTSAKLVELGYKLPPHPPYSPNLVPCDFFLFPNLKKSLAGQKFESNEEVIAATEAYFAVLQKSWFSDGFKKLEYRWVKCIELKGCWEIFPKFSFLFCRLSTYRTALVYLCCFSNYEVVFYELLSVSVTISEFSRKCRCVGVVIFRVFVDTCKNKVLLLTDWKRLVNDPKLAGSLAGDCLGTGGVSVSKIEHPCLPLLSLPTPKPRPSFLQVFRGLYRVSQNADIARGWVTARRGRTRRIRTSRSRTRGT